MTSSALDLVSVSALGLVAMALTVGGALGWCVRGRRQPAWTGRGSATATQAPAVRSGVTEPSAANAAERPAESRAGGPPLEPAIRELLAATTEQADELISIVRPDGTLAHANAAFCRAVGCDLAAVRERKSVDMLAEQSRASLREIESAARGEGTWRGTLVRQRHDGTTFITSATVMALTDAAANVGYFVGIERDVTQESQLRELLIHSERLAAVGQLVSGVAHELNNPLQAVIGYTELLIDAERRKEPRADLERVRAEAHRAAKIVRNLLAFVRRSAVERAPALVNDLVRATVALRRYELALSGIELREEYADEVPLVLVNREEIQQVLLNLLLNAEQAMKTAGRSGCLRVRTGYRGDEVAIEIADNGPGVPATVARRIFEPFYTTKGVGEGTGLGLSIALGIAEAHGGTLALAGEGIDGGACFQLMLPAAVGVEAATTPAGRAMPTWTAVPGRRALVADDEEALRKLLHRLLTRRGFAVDVAEDGAQAANLVEVNRYDVILCDVQMPRMTGTQLYESLRRRQPHLAAAFVLISGDILNGPLQAFVEAAQIPLLSKPFGARNLDLVLDQVLTHRMQSPDRLSPPETRAS